MVSYFTQTLYNLFLSFTLTIKLSSVWLSFQADLCALLQSLYHSGALSYLGHKNVSTFHLVFFQPQPWNQIFLQGDLAHHFSGEWYLETDRDRFLWKHLQSG